MENSQADGSTPLDPGEAHDLRVSHVATHGELDELEEANIQSALTWAERKTLSGGRRADVLTEKFLYELHRRMFGAVWTWAGQPRRTNKNIGVDKSAIGVEVVKLLDDARHWREHAVFPADESAIRFHHRLVSIHPFTNGNGRHARLMADLLVQQAGRPAFSWGAGNLESTSDLRSAYIGALRKADAGNPAPLLEFARA
ncbi:MAG: mobile mystery protein B [Gemmatimonadaceae bacterium]